MRHAKKDNIADTYLDMMKAQFGHVADSCWYYDDDRCPCCRKNPLGEIEYQGQRAVSLNGFMYRAKGVLIGYMLCGDCAEKILQKSNEAKARGEGTTDMHRAIEWTLVNAYLRYCASLDA